MNARTKQILGDCVVAAIMCLILAFVANDARSAEPFDAKAAQDAYDRYDAACDAGNVKACKAPEYAMLGSQLSEMGWMIFPDRTWIKVEQIQKLNAYLRSVENGTQIDLYGTYNSRFAIMSQFRQVLPAASLAVWWRVNSASIREAYPGAWAVLSGEFDAIVAQQRLQPHYTTRF